MATYSVASGEVGTPLFDMVASTVDTVNFVDDAPSIDVVNTSSTDAVWYTTDGTTPTVGGARCYFVPAGMADTREAQRQDGANRNVIKLISSGTPAVRVQRGV